MTILQNQKKSWHPHTFKNQERVWKAEQNEAAEKQKLAELQREITEERGREELRRIGQASGVLGGGGKDDHNKLEWMYRGPKENLNREDYLLGRTVDKTFEQFAEDERATEKQEHLGVSVPKNHVEYECVPFSIRAYKDADPTSVQVDMARKIAEDPLMMIKQREMESRKRLLENPVKLKELKLLLQSERKKKGSKSEGKKSKKDKKSKSKKSKKKRKKRSKSESSSSSSSGSGDDSDVDDALLAMLSKQRTMAEDEVDMEDLNFEEMVTLKYDTLNKELDKMIGGDEKMKQNNNNNRRREEGDHSGSDERSGRRRGPGTSKDDRGGGRRVERSRSRDRPNRDAFERRSDRRPENYQREADRQLRRDRDRRRSRERSPDERRKGREVRNRSRDRGESSSMRNNNYRPRRRSPSAEKSKRQRADSRSPRKNSPDMDKSSRIPNRDRSRENPQRGKDDSDDDRSRRGAVNRNYGLVTASGESIALKNPVKPYTDRKAPEATRDTKKNDWKKTTSSSSSRPKLSDAEKAERLREMMKDAEVRDKERESYVRNYHEADRKEEERHREKEFDKNFIHKELHKSAQTETVESRLKSNRNNIQRSSGAMDTNFAKR